MDLTTISTLISSVGFPIACCIFLFKQNEKHSEEVDKLRASLDNNTKVMNKILRKLKIDDEEDEE